MKSFRIFDPKLERPVSPGSCALAVMTKAPQAGRVKTRLVPPLTPEDAAELNKCFLHDTATAISDACTGHVCGVAVYTPVGAESLYENILPPGFSLLPQRGDGFGERLNFATEDLFNCGFESVCLIDSDSPTVPTKVFAEAAELLKESDDCVVLGPSDDGGYYLIGIKKPHRELFENIDWSTDRVFEQTKQRAAGLGIDIKLLPSGYDIDDAAGLTRLRGELLAENAPEGLARCTREFLRELVAQRNL